MTKTTKQHAHAHASPTAEPWNEANILVATPGCLLRVLEKQQSSLSSSPKQLSLASSSLPSSFASRIQNIVLYEADRLATQTDLCEQVETILQHLVIASASSSAVRLLLCSATWATAATPVWQRWMSVP